MTWDGMEKNTYPERVPTAGSTFPVAFSTRTAFICIGAWWPSRVGTVAPELIDNRKDKRKFNGDGADMELQRNKGQRTGIERTRSARKFERSGWHLDVAREYSFQFLRPPLLFWEARAHVVTPLLRVCGPRRRRGVEIWVTLKVLGPHCNEHQCPMSDLIVWSVWKKVLSTSWRLGEKLRLSEGPGRDLSMETFLPQFLERDSESASEYNCTFGFRWASRLRMAAMTLRALAKGQTKCGGMISQFSLVRVSSVALALSRVEKWRGSK
ncbi:hypothetical protein BGW80DRAFT_1444125 [Lactifluus volemus]|nr:hypothetical protein BGW80DRAFT_1444125 [Lactifluus volemus]